MILQRHVIDVAGVERRDDRDFGTLQNRAIFSRSLSGNGRSQRHSSTSGWTPRLESSRTDCWVGLVFSSPAAAIHGTSVVWTLTRIVAAEVVPQLADRLDERQALDVADRPADLADDEVEPVGIGQREFLDRIGDVGNDLDGRAEIVAAPLVGDDVAVDAPGGDVVRLLRRHAGEPLVMPEVEVGLRPVVGHVDFTMLIGRHRPRIDVEIRIELPDADLVATRLEERPKRRREKTFSKR